MKNISYPIQRKLCFLCCLLTNPGGFSNQTDAKTNHKILFAAMNTLQREEVCVGPAWDCKQLVSNSHDL